MEIVKLNYLSRIPRFLILRLSIESMAIIKVDASTVDENDRNKNWEKCSYWSKCHF